jgi:purine-binding chemotaxis protein CheW
LASFETTIPDPAVSARTLLFRVAGSVYGCDIDRVREIVPHRRASRLPGAPPYVQGLINLRGTIVTVLDLGVRLASSGAAGRRDGRADEHIEGEGDVGSASGRSIILVEHGSRVVGAAVDEVMDVQAIDVEPVEAGSGEARGGLVRGLGRLEGDVVVLLDMDTLITQVLL